MNDLDRYVFENPRWRRILFSPLFLLLSAWRGQNLGMAMVMARFSMRKVGKHERRK